MEQEPAKQDGTDGELFRFHENPRKSIPPVREVLTPPEELRKDKVRRILAIAGSALLLSLTGYAIYYFASEASVEGAVLRAGAEGDRQSREDARNAVGDAPSGLRARLVAADALVGFASLDDAEQALAAVPEDSAHVAEQHKAQVYVHLLEGEVQQAQAVASRLIPQGTYAAETAYVRSLAQLAVGELPSALAGIEAARDIEDGARYQGMHVLLKGLSGDLPGALALAEEEPSHPVRCALDALMVLVRAEVDSPGEDSPELAPREGAWLQLRQAAVAHRRGENAEETLVAAVERAPQGDALFVLGAAELAVAVGKNEMARELLEGIGPSPLPHRKAEIEVALMLHGGQAERALEVLGNVPASPSAMLLVAQAQSRLGNTAAARGAFAHAAENPAWKADALARWIPFELSEGQNERALGLAEDGLGMDAPGPRLVAEAVRALVAGGRADRAQSELNSAMQAHPGNRDLQEALGDLHFSAEAWAEALGAYRAALGAGASPLLQAKLGIAAQRSGDAATARQALESAWGAGAETLQDRAPEVLHALFGLDLAEGNLAHAETLLGAIEATPADARAVLLRLRFFVARGDGMSQRSAANRARELPELSRSGEVRYLAAELHREAGLYAAAVGLYGQAMHFREPAIEMLVSKALAFALDGRTRQANEALQDARERDEAAATALPRYWVARARIEANVGRFGRAREFAEQAVGIDAQETEAHLTIAEANIRENQPAVEPLRAAVNAPGTSARALALLAQRVQGAEACSLAQRYLEVAVRSEQHHDQVERIASRCP